MASSSVHDPKVLDVLSAIDPIELNTYVYRAVFEGRDPTAGSLAGGRWAPPQQFEVLYTSTEEECAIAEVLFHLRRQPIFPTKPVYVHKLRVRTRQTVDLTPESVCASLGLDEQALTSLDYSTCQDIGHAAEFLGFDSLVVSSARCESANLVLIMGHLVDEIMSVSSRPINWTDYSD